MNALQHKVEREIMRRLNENRISSVTQVERLARLIGYCARSQSLGPVFGYKSFNAAWVGKIFPMLEDIYLSNPYRYHKSFLVLGELIEWYDPLFIGFVQDSGYDHGIAA